MTSRPENRESSKNMGLLQVKYGQDVSRITRYAMKRFYGTLERMLAHVEADAVLDAGCGEGHILSQFLDRRFTHVCGLDLDSSRLSFALRSHDDLHLAQANIQSLPLQADAVDLVLALEVLEHVGDPRAALAELNRVTRRYVILSVPNEPFWRIGNMARGAYWSSFGNTPEHINHWSIWGFKRFVSQLFNVRDIAACVTWTFILGEKRL